MKNFLAQLTFTLRRTLLALGSIRRRRAKPPGYVLMVLDGEYPELPPARPFWQRRLMPSDDSLRDLSDHFRTIAADPRVDGVVLHLRGLEIPMARLDTMRDHIAELRDSGKRVVAWSTNYTTSNYYVACAADEILIQPGGSVWPLGLRRTYMFLADALSQHGLEFDSVPITSFKSAGDTFSRSEMSDELREMSNWLIGAQYEALLSAIAAGRGVYRAGAERLADGAAYTDLEAKEAGAVDALVGEEDLPLYLGAEGEPARMDTWQNARKTLLHRALPRPGKHVALLRIEGMIVDGRSARPPMKPPIPLPLVAEPRAGDLTVVADARKVLADDQAAAVVVYVDSPGGSATGSEAMAAALAKVAEKKPLVVAMGPVAGSGGYYVATPGNWIVAQPTTITGSIGVIYGKFVNADLLDRLRFNRETVSRGRGINFWSGESRFSDEERAKVWDSIQRVYDVFVARVSESRRMTTDGVDAIGGGRVWTGSQALENGLVDQLGGLDTALAKARELAGLDDDAPMQEVSAGKRLLAPAPVPSAGAMIGYVADGMRQLNRARALCLGLLWWPDEG